MEPLSTLERAMRLRNVELFRELETDALALVASIAQQVHCPKGEVLFAQDSPSDALYVVLSGRVEMSRSDRVVAGVGPNETIGNWAFFDDQPSMAAARAVEDSRLLRIERADFFDLLDDHQEITPRMFEALFRRVRSLLTAGLGEQAEPAASPSAAAAPAVSDDGAGGTAPADGGPEPSPTD